MFVEMLKAKIHRATITDANLHYKGSMTVPKVLLAKSGMLPGEKIQVVNINNGARLETYIQAGDDPKEICLNGAAARLGEPGDRAILITYALMTEEEAKDYRPTIVLMGDDNEIESVENPKD